KSIIPKGPATKKGVDLKPGDVIVAVNGNKVEAGVNRNQYFTSPTLGSELVLTVRRGAEEVKTRIRPISSAVFKELLYDQWIADNRAKVDELSNNKIAYVYMKNMSESELENFYLDMAAYENQKQGVILDLRYNTGGNVHDDVLKFLSQKPYLQWKYREGKKSPQGHFAPSGKPIVLLINQQSLSDAEMTSAGFKELGLGKIIGTETYRWIIFTSAKGDRKSTRLNSSHVSISYAVFCLNKNIDTSTDHRRRYRSHRSAPDLCRTRMSRWLIQRHQRQPHRNRAADRTCGLRSLPRQHTHS